MVRSGGFLGRLLLPLLKTGSPLLKNVLKSLAKSVLIPLGLTAAVSGTNATIQKQVFGSSKTTLIKSNEDINGSMKLIIIKIIKFLEESCLLIRLVSETIKD